MDLKETIELRASMRERNGRMERRDIRAERKTRGLENEGKN